MTRKNGATATRLQPIATCRHLGSTLLDLSIVQRKLESQRLIRSIEDNSVWVQYIFGLNAAMSCWLVSFLSLPFVEEISTTPGLLAFSAAAAKAEGTVTLLGGIRSVGVTGS